MLKFKSILLFFLVYINYVYSSSPRLFNFQINSPQNSRVYFESSEVISASNYIGFFISSKNIISVNINTGATTGHYFVVDTAFDFWDNNTIRYQGGSNFQNTTGDSLVPFTLSYIDNNIPEPTANTYRYVTNTATGGGDGLSEATAWTLQEGFTNAISGMTVWMKAGNYGEQWLQIYNIVGTATSPVKFIGYKNIIGDISTNYWDYGIIFDTSEMPTITGTYNVSNPTGSDYGRAMWVGRSHYVILRNFQIQKYYHGIHTYGQITNLNSNIILDKVNGYDFAGGAYTSVFNFETDDAIDWVGNSNFRIINSVLMNYEMNGINIKGDGHCLVENCKIYNDDPNRKPDYQLNINGDNNIIRNNYIEIKWDGYTASTHGIGVRGAGKSSSNYNLFENNEAVNLNESFYIRNVNCDYNVIKNNIANNNGATSTYRGGIYIWGGSDYNIIENNIFNDMIVGIGFKDNFEEDNIPTEDYEIGKYNLIRNNIFNGFQRAIGIEEQTAGGDGILYDNYIYNNTFYNGGYMFNYDDNLDVQRLNLTNNIFHSISNYQQGSNPTEGEIFIYNDFYNCGFATPSGTGNINLNPQFTDPTNGDFHLQNTSLLIDAGTSLTEVMFDFDGKDRIYGTNYDIGAYEYDTSLVCATYRDTVNDIIHLGDSVLFGSNYYANSGIYYDSLLSVEGCDSIIHLNLLVNKILSICQSNPNIFIDGVEEIDWFLLDSIDLEKTSDTSMPTAIDLSSKFKLFWDDSSLNILVKVIDDTLVSDNGVSYWHDDGVSLYIDRNNKDSTEYSSNDYAIGLPVGSSDIYVNGVLYTQNDFKKYVTITQTGYFMELKLKWNFLGFIPTAGDSLGFDLYVTDDDDGGGRDKRIMWNDSTNNSPVNPSYMGTIVLGSVQCAVSPVSYIRDTNAVSICNGDSALFGGNYYKLTGFYSDTITGTNNTDTIHVLSLTVLNNVTTNISNTICQGDSVLFSGVYRKASGTYTETTTGSNGCDSITYLNLTVTNGVTANISNTICQGDSVLFGGLYRKTPGTYTETTTGSNGCDSTTYLNLTVTNGVTANISNTICQGDSILFGGVYRKTSGTYTETTTGSNSCDSTTYLNLSVTNGVTSNISNTICQGDSILFGGVYRKTSGTYTETTTGSNGCDSTTYLNLSVTNGVTANISNTICQGDSILFGGVHRKTTGTYTETTTGSNGCDSTTYLNLMVNPSIVQNIFDTICQGDSLYFNGSYVTTAGGYTAVYTAQNGCDSTIKLILSVQSVTSVTATSSTDTVYLGNSVYFNGTSPSIVSYRWDFGDFSSSNQQNAVYTYSSTGVFTVILEGELPSGCVMYDTLTITVLGNTGVEDLSSLLDKIKVYPNPTRDNFKVTFSLEKEMTVSIEVYNSSGKLVISKQKEQVKQTVMSFDEIANFERGLYFVRIISDNKIIKTEKLIVH